MEDDGVWHWRTDSCSFNESVFLSSMENILNEEEKKIHYDFENFTRRKEEERDKLIEDFLSKF